MTTIHHKLTASLLALTIALTVGAESTYAQFGKSMRGLMQGRSSTNGGGNNGGGRSFNLSNGPSHSFSNNSFSNNNAFQSNNSFQNASKRLGNSFNSSRIGNSLNLNQNTTNAIQNIRGGNLNLGNNSRINTNRIGQVLGNGNLGNGNLGNAVKNDRKDRIKAGLQNLLQNGNKGNIGGNLLGGQKNLLGGQHDGDHKHGKVATKILDLIQHNQKHGKVCVKQHDWCHTKPKACHWWYDWCKPIAYCEPHHHVHCSWNYVTCDFHHNGRLVAADARWYLGLKGLLLPGQGVGIEEVTPGSPADAVGLQPGMVITRVNGIDLVDEAALGYAIEHSDGVLRMDLRLSAAGAPATCVVVMQRVVSYNY